MITASDIKVYVAGPMRGYPDFNFPAFDAAAEALRELGYQVRSPAEHDRESGFDETQNTLAGFDMQAAFRWDIESVLWATHIALLRGWRSSEGVAIELAVARATGCQALEYDPRYSSLLVPLPDESPLAEADRLVSGARQQSYGHPIEDFTRTGRMWGAILGIGDVDPAHVGLCMAAVKISREVHAPKRDNLVDLAGYAKTVHLVREAQSDGR